MSRLVGRAGVAALVALAGTVAIVYAATRGGDGSPAGRSAGSWGSLAPSPLERTEVGAASVGDGI